MKIAFFHGLESKPISDKTEFLIQNFESAYIPAMDYLDSELFNRVLREIQIRKPDLLIGSSMGGWFAYCISTITGIPTLLFNPAVQGRSQEPFVKRGSTKAKHTVVFGKADNLIIPSKSISWFKTNGIGKFDFNFESNGHRTPIGIFQKWVKRLTRINEGWSIETAEGPDLGFLPESTQDLMRANFATSRPSTGFGLTVESEIDKVITAQKLATEEDFRFAHEINKSPSDAFYRWLIIRGEKPSFQEIDGIWTNQSSVEIIKKMKDAFKRPRPYWVSANIKAISGSETASWSYPSGHALGAWNIAIFLSKKYPHLTDGLFNLAQRCAESRVVAGVHYPSDIRVSKEIAFEMELKI